MASVGQDLADVPFPAMVRALATSIAEAQFALDLVSVQIAQMMAGSRYNETKKDYESDPKLLIPFGPQNKFSLLELGFTPTFYQFVDTIIEIKISITMSSSSEQSGTQNTTDASLDASASVGWGSATAGVHVKSSSVNAAYASKYQYSAEGSSLLRTKLVPVPPPAILQERIRAMFPPPRTK